MNNSKTLQWILRVAVFGEFLGHGIFALQGKKAWIDWTVQLTGMSLDSAGTFIFCVGVVDIIISLIVLLRPIKIVLLWAAFWGFWTALVRPLVGEPVWDFVERWANWGAPLALLIILGWPRSIKEWLK